MWLAHALTLSRIPIALALWSTYGDAARSLALVVIAALTDAADGNLARWMRRRRQRPEPPHAPDIKSMGDWLDPLVDKLFVAIVLVLIWVRGGSPLVVILIGARELLFVPLTALYAALRPQLGGLRADPIGKAATIAQFTAIAVAIAAPPWALPAAAIAAALGLATVAHYALRVVRGARPAPLGDTALRSHT